MTSGEIREQFLTFFQNNGHKIVASDPIVLKNDPTLMFTNAGMNQFKEYFLGVKSSTHKRIADTQKCLRVSGKHNDLEDVGVDTYHHTMFEMLGNWSFGDYFKKEAIMWSWQLLTEIYGIDKDRFYVTVFEGDNNENLNFDKEAYEVWESLIAKDRILKGSKKDNFWEMGDTGPCGPCTEIHIDCRTDLERQAIDGSTLVNNDHPQVIEIWNNVFIQYNRKADGSLEELPEKHVDTGMGFERLVRVLQGKNSNYDTDIFQPLIQFISHKVNIPYGNTENTDIAMRVLSDHIRAISFCIADGQLPSNTGAGYVVRRILRRAVRYYFSTLSYKQPLLVELVDILALQMKDVFPELYVQLDYIKKVIASEEQNFLGTLENGLKRLSQIEASNPHEISGNDAFELYDTYGFPLDLTKIIAAEKNRKVDELGFHTQMHIQKERSRKATTTTAGDWNEVNPSQAIEFVGYDSLTCDAKVLRYRTLHQKGTSTYQIVLDKTPFYAEAGGQIGDQGILYFGDDSIQVLDTKKENNQIIHFVDRWPDDFDIKVITQVNETNRRAIENNHSVTHLLHAALRQIIGSHVAQKGSYCGTEYLRFDFSHFSKIEDEQLQEIESMVNTRIRQNIALDEKRNVPMAEAIKSGAIALFGEKYGDTVRIITFDPNFSKELCGGTHVKATGQIGFFKIISESGIAAGVRRIEAITAIAAEKYINNQISILHSIKDKLKTKDIEQSIDNLQQLNGNLQRQFEDLLMEKANQIKATIAAQKENIAGMNCIINKIQLDHIDAIKKICFELRNEIPNLFLVIGAESNGKAILSIAISDDIVKSKNLHAGNIIKQYSKYIHGSGGGQAFYATAGGTDPNGINTALECIKKEVIYAHSEVNN